MSEAVTVRPAHRADLDGLLGLLETVSPMEVFDADMLRNGLEMMLNNGRGRILAAEATDGTVVGMCSGQLTVSTAEGGPAILVDDIVVLEDWRGQGIGAQLMDAIAEWARENESARLQLLAQMDKDPAPGSWKQLGSLSQPTV